MDTVQPPSREDVASRWQAVARGDVTREECSRWAEPLMFAEFARTPDVMVLEAIQHLHGFDMTYRSDDLRLIGHGPPGPYVRSLSEVADEFDAWMEQCAAYDQDPERWLADRRRMAESYVREERARQAREGRDTDS